MAFQGGRLVACSHILLLLLAAELYVRNLPFCQALTENLASHVRLLKTSPSNQLVMVFDALYSKEVTASLQNYAYFHTKWSLTQEREFCESGVEEEIARDCGEGSSTGDVPWTSPLDPEWFSKSRMWVRVQEALAFATNDSGRDFHPSSVRAEILQRGDNVVPHAATPSAYSKEYSARIFLVPEWQMNDYGDMTFYSPSTQNRTEGSNYDIFLTVRPHPGRLVLWDSTLLALYRPPSMGYIQDLLSVSIQLSPSRDKFEMACTQWKEANELTIQRSLQPFPRAAEPVGDVDVGSHLVRTWKTKEGRKVMVFDDLFTEAYLELLRAYLVEFPGPLRMGYDFESFELSDNTPWIKMFDAIDFSESSAWEVLSQVVSYVAGGQPTWFPYDVSVNVVRSADHTRVHEDCEEWEDEYTMVMFLNPDFGLDDYGETIFYDSRPLDSYSRKLYAGISEHDYDAICAVTPKYGRLVIFPGIVPHSARPPSTGYTKARYTFAVKTTVSRRRAFVKKLREHLDEKGDVTEEEEELLHQILRAERADDQSFQTEEWLETRWRKTRDSLMTQLEETKRRLERLLS